MVANEYNIDPYYKLFMVKLYLKRCVELAKSYAICLEFAKIIGIANEEFLLVQLRICQ